MTAARAIFLTGTDTDVGKTTFAAALCYAIAKAGFAPAYYKPVLSGAERIADQLIGGDLTFVQQTAELTDTQFACSYLFEPAVSPHLAAQMAGLQITPQTLKADYEAMTLQASHLVVEGAGGAACPLSADEPIYTMAHLMAEYQAPVLIACRAKLGTLHHTMTTVAYLRNFNVSLAGLLVNGYEDDPVCRDNLLMLERMTGLPVLATLPKLQDCNPQNLRHTVDTHWDAASLVRRLFP